MGDFPHSACAGKVRSIQNYHMDTKGWADIAYSFLVCPHGDVFEGRGWGVRTAANGTAKGNDWYHAVCYLGGTGDPFTAEAQRAIVWLVNEGRRIYGGQEVRAHAYFRPTECPGETIRQWLAGDPFAAPTTPSGVTVFNPPLSLPPIVSSAKDPERGGSWLLAQDGAVFAFDGARYLGGANGKAYFAGRTASHLEVTADGRYTIVATSGERYGPGF